LCNLENF